MNYIPSFIPSVCFTSFGKSGTIESLLQAYLFSLALRTLNGEEDLEAKEARHFRTHITNKGSEERD